MQTIPKAMHSLLWAVLGLPNLDVLKIINTYGEKGLHTKEFHHDFTEVVGTILYAMFLIVAATVMLNTLVSMMTGAGATALENSELEWKFARSQVSSILSLAMIRK
jgi:hypothetical protein